MIKLLIALLFVQAFYCAEFSDLKNHIKLTWNNVSLGQNFDGNQTVSDKNGNVDGFILCGMFDNGAENDDCSYNYQFVKISGGSYSSFSGDGNFTTKFVSKVDEKSSCFKFYNPVAGFKEVYEATIVKKGSWSVTYDCKKYIPESKEEESKEEESKEEPKEESKEESKDYTWISFGVIMSILVIVGAKYLKKEKSQKEGKTEGNIALVHQKEGKTEGNNAPLQNSDKVFLTL